MSNNQLEKLPDSIGDIIVGGNLMLQSNRLKTLPLSFQEVRVGGIVNVRKQLQSSFHTVGAELPFRAQMRAAMSQGSFTGQMNSDPSKTWNIEV